LGDEPIRGTFWSLGYDYEMIIKTGEENYREIFRSKIIHNIENNRPVISYDIIGPPDEGVVTGYDKNGQVLLGRSYFHDSTNGYYEKDDWYDACLGLVLIGEKRETPAKQRIYLEALRWVVQLAKEPEVRLLAKNNNQHLNGFAAFDAWIDALKNDAYFPKDDMDELTLSCQIHSNVTLSGLFDSRRAAVAFLKGMNEGFPAGKAYISKAVDAYEKESGFLLDGLKSAPFAFQPEKQRLRMADPEMRSNLSALIRKSKEKEIQAISHIEHAIEEMEKEASVFP
jgi:hypothetical protein